MKKTNFGADLLCSFSDPSSITTKLDWIERFNQALMTIRSIADPVRGTLGFNPLSVEEHVRESLLRANTGLIELEQDFISTAKTYGKIIISERYLEEKTIKPLSLGGMAGGEKYIVHNILFKFAVDFHGLYNGDFGASKVAGHELKGAMAYFSAFYDQNVCLPMIALVDYLGFRLIVMSLLPVDKETIIYGTADGGFTIHADDSHFNNMMEIAATRLNLESHRCGLQKFGDDEGTLLHSAADVEGHRGKDGKYYLLDFSRTFPPCPPSKEIQGSHLFRLFRPEFVLDYPKRLCSDAFSGFVNCDSHKMRYCEDAKEALDYLTGDVCFQLSQLLKSVAIEKKDLNSLIQLIHSKGVNIRFLGVILRHSQKMSGEFRAFLLCEVVARVVKNEIRALLREVMRKIRVPMEASYRMAVVDYLNLVLVDQSKKSTKYWNNNLKGILSSYYHVTWPYTEKNFDIRSFLKSKGGGEGFVGLGFLFSRIVQLASLKMSELAVSKIEKGNFLKNWDLVEFQEKINHLNIIADTKGTNDTLLGLHHLQSADIPSSKYYLQMAEEKFSAALRSNPNNSSLREQLAISSAGCLIVTYILEKNQEYKLRSQNWPKVKLDPSDSGVQSVDSCFQSAIQDTEKPILFSLYASFLVLCGRHDVAEGFFFKAFQKEISVGFLTAYVEMLNEIGESQIANIITRQIHQISAHNKKYGKPPTSYLGTSGPD